MSVTINGTSGLTFNDATTQNTSAFYGGLGFRNRIINGAMMIDQRNAGASVTGNNGTYSVDRWFADTSASSKFTMQQNAGSVTPPVGFTNYLGITSSSAYSVTSGDYFLLEQRIEGFNISDLAWGTANAKSVTLSFQVYSSLTGTFGGALGNSGNNQSYPFSYTISSANTWTTVSVPISGATGGTWLTTNGTGIKVFFGLGVGSTYSGTAGSWSSNLYLSATGATSVVGTNGATFYITGVQLEKGSTATSFDYRPYGTELALCQRYFVKFGGNYTYEAIGSFGTGTGSTTSRIYIPLPVPMRTQPSVSASTLELQDGYNAAVAITSVSNFSDGTSQLNGYIQANTASGLTAGRPYAIRAAGSTNGNLSYSAEL